MFRPNKNKLLFLVYITVVILFTSCVDIGVESIPESVTYYSQLKFTNLVSGATAATLTLNGQSIGSVNFGSETPDPQSAFLTTLSGSKTLLANFGGAVSKTFQFAATTEYKIRVFLVGTTNSNELVASNQRYIWQTKDSDNGKALFPADTGHISIFNGSPDAIISSVTINGATTIEFDSPLELGKGSEYIKLKAGSYSFDVLYNDSLHVNFNYTLAAKSRYTSAIYDAAASIKNAVFIDD